MSAIPTALFGFHRQYENRIKKRIGNKYPNLAWVRQMSQSHCGGLWCLQTGRNGWLVLNCADRSSSIRCFVIGTCPMQQPLCSDLLHHLIYGCGQIVIVLTINREVLSLTVSTSALACSYLCVGELSQ
jgi:hypothetical protein